MADSLDLLDKLQNKANELQDEVKGLTQERTEMWAAVRALQQEKKRMNATIADLQNAAKKKKKPLQRPRVRLGR